MESSTTAARAPMSAPVSGMQESATKSPPRHISKIAFGRQSLLGLVHAIVRSGATFPWRTVRAGPLPPRPAREIALRSRRYEDHRLTGHVP